MPGFADLVQKSVGIEVRHGVPDVRGTVPAELRDPVYATAIGTLLWGLTEFVPEDAGYGVSNGNGNGHANGHNTKQPSESNGLFGSLKRRLGALIS
jgi:cell division ATPase FtsA